MSRQETRGTTRPPHHLPDPPEAARSRPKPSRTLTPNNDKRVTASRADRRIPRQRRQGHLSHIVRPERAPADVPNRCSYPGAVFCTPRPGWEGTGPGEPIAVPDRLCAPPDVVILRAGDTFPGGSSGERAGGGAGRGPVDPGGCSSDVQVCATPGSNITSGTTRRWPSLLDRPDPRRR
jgi:hypothetical protein